MTNPQDIINVVAAYDKVTTRRIETLKSLMDSPDDFKQISDKPSLEDFTFQNVKYTLSFKEGTPTVLLNGKQTSGKSDINMEGVVQSKVISENLKVVSSAPEPYKTAFEVLLDQADKTVLDYQRQLKEASEKGPLAKPDSKTSSKQKDKLGVPNTVKPYGP
jgi:hypothetical protein